MRVALTGTPGTGKTAVATLLENKGYCVVRLNELAIQQGFIDGVDEQRNSKLIDINTLNSYIKKNFTTDDLVFFEGHVSHLLKAMNKIIILRCHPKKLQKRLATKKWKKEKIQENIDAETLDVILCEAVERHPQKTIFEIDTTQKTRDEVADCIVDIIQKDFKPTKPYSIGQIDWSEEILNKYK